MMMTWQRCTLGQCSRWTGEPRRCAMACCSISKQQSLPGLLHPRKDWCHALCTPPAPSSRRPSWAGRAKRSCAGALMRHMLRRELPDDDPEDGDYEMPDALYLPAAMPLVGGWVVGWVGGWVGGCAFLALALPLFARPAAAQLQRRQLRRFTALCSLAAQPALCLTSLGGKPSAAGKGAGAGAGRGGSGLSAAVRQPSVGA
jgi:hypothetical protein